MSHEVGELLIKWYASHKRDLPWRHTKDPYLIWISEIVLQQTRVAQGTPYYYRLIESFPTIFDLARASEQEVLKNWEGLGYYSRARNMHFTAKQIVAQLAGIFPNTHQEILKLKGVGKYTAAAIASFAFGESVAVLDGNVMRVLSRIYDLHADITSLKTQESLRTLANQLIVGHNPAVFNQAIMEFGSLQSTPTSPSCGACVCQQLCLAVANKTQEILPVKSKKVKIKKRYFNYIVIVNQNEEYWLKPRQKGDIWEGLFDFYLVETSSEIDQFDQLDFDPVVKNALDFERLVKGSRHILSHQHIFANFWICNSVDHQIEVILGIENMTKHNLIQIQELPVPILIKNFLKKI